MNLNLMIPLKLVKFEFYLIFKFLKSYGRDKEGRLGFSKIKVFIVKIFTLEA